MDYRPIPLAGAVGEKVVDIGIQRTLAALEDRPGDVLLLSHDGDFLPEIRKLLGLGPARRADRRSASSSTPASPSSARPGSQFFDLESDVRCFNAILPRVRIIPLDEFDPVALPLSRRRWSEPGVAQRGRRARRPTPAAA